VKSLNFLLPKLLCFLYIILVVTLIHMQCFSLPLLFKLVLETTIGIILVVYSDGYHNAFTGISTIIDLLTVLVLFEMEIF